jgi:hypothetical protein
MSQTVVEVLRKDKDIREFLVTVDEDKKTVDNGMFSGLPGPRDIHPDDSNLIAWNTWIEKIEGLQYKALVCYRPIDAYDKQALPRKEVISVQSGDVIAIYAIHEMKRIEYECVSKHIKELYPDNEVMIFDKGMTMEVYREQEKV